jgi:transcriptional/translational regulatory protein YebC/TACO1
VLSAPENFEAVKKALTTAGFVPLRADVVMRPENRVAVSDEVAETLRDLIDWLEGLDDVQEVYHNAALGGQS